MWRPAGGRGANKEGALVRRASAGQPSHAFIGFPVACVSDAKARKGSLRPEHPLSSPRHLDQRSWAQLGGQETKVRVLAGLVRLGDLPMLWCQSRCGEAA